VARAQLVERKVEGGVHGLAFSRDGRRALTASWTAGVRVLDVETLLEIKKPLAEAPGPQRVPHLPWFLSGERALSVTEGGHLLLWTIDRGEVIVRIDAHAGRPTWGLAVSRDETRVLTGGNDGLVKLWDLATGAELKRFAGNKGSILWVALSPD